MKNHSKKNEVNDDFTREEYKIDYKAGVRGKYYRPATEQNGYVKLIPEVQKVFKTSELVNNALLSILNAIPNSKNSVL